MDILWFWQVLLNVLFIFCSHMYHCTVPSSSRNIFILWIASFIYFFNILVMSFQIYGRLGRINWNFRFARNCLQYLYQNAFLIFFGNSFLNNFSKKLDFYFFKLTIKDIYYFIELFADTNICISIQKTKRKIILFIKSRNSFKNFKLNPEFKLSYNNTKILEISFCRKSFV